MYIKRIRLQDIRCFRSPDITLNLTEGRVPWTMVMGDNASGKTTLLKAIAIGLCDSSSAAGLLRESDTGYIRHHGSRARIQIDLVSSEDFNLSTIVEPRSYRIDTRITELPNSELEMVGTQTTVPRRDEFPWEKLFVCAYGAGRGTSGTGDFGSYTVLNSVYSLFNYNEGLQNPELTIWRLRERGMDREVLDAISNVLHIDTITIAAQAGTQRGLLLSGAWGYAMPLRDLADGYKSTFLWITDFIGWALTHQPEIRGLQDIAGIVLIDELEQHLHPKWQRTVVSTLREQFPKVQFITTTHSPLVARSVSELGEETSLDKLLHFKLGIQNEVGIAELGSLKGLRSDQVLASEAFDWLVDGTPEAEEVLTRASELEAKGDSRSSTEEEEYAMLKSELSNILLLEGQTLIERTIESERYARMMEEIGSLKRRLDL